MPGTAIERAIRPPDEGAISNSTETSSGNSVGTREVEIDTEVIASYAPDPIPYVAPMAPAPPPPVQPWAGWPEDWTPWWSGTWGRLQALTDTAWACLDLNSSILATMPPYQLTNGVVSTPRSWMENPNPDVYASWEEFAKQMFWSFQLGEVFVVADSYFSDGFPARFHIVDPWYVNIDVINGFKRYMVGSLDITLDVLHIPYMSWPDDVRGHGPLEVGQARLIAANVLRQYATSLAEQGGVPSFVIKHPDWLTDKQTKKLQQQWWESRIQSLGLPAVLSGGIEIEQLQVNPKDMALVDLSQFNESRISILLGVPPFLMGLPSGGDSLTYSTTVQLFDYHWRSSLRPKAQTVMAALSQWLLPRGSKTELNRDEYVRGGMPERAQYYQTLHNIVDNQGRRAITVPEIRTMERLAEEPLGAMGVSGVSP